MVDKKRRGRQASQRPRRLARVCGARWLIRLVAWQAFCGDDGRSESYWRCLDSAVRTHATSQSLVSSPLQRPSYARLCRVLGQRLEVIRRHGRLAAAAESSDIAARQLDFVRSDYTITYESPSPGVFTTRRYTNPRLSLPLPYHDSGKNLQIGLTHNVACSAGSGVVCYTVVSLGWGGAGCSWWHPPWGDTRLKIFVAKFSVFF